MENKYDPIRYNCHWIRGMSLIATVIVFAIASMIVASVMLWSPIDNLSRMANISMGQLSAIQQTVHSMFAGKSDYAGLTDSVLASSGKLPDNMVNISGTLQHAFNGKIVVSTDKDSNKFYVQYNSLPATGCQKLSTMNIGTGLFSITVIGDDSISVLSRALTPSEADTVCGTSNNAIIRWTLF